MARERRGPRPRLVKSPTWKLLSSFITGPVSDRRRSCSPVFCDLTLAATHPPISFSSILTVLFSPLLSSPLLSSLYSRFLRGLSTPWSILYRPRLRRKPPSPSRALSWVDRFFVTYLFLKSFSLSLSLSLSSLRLSGEGGIGKRWNIGALWCGWITATGLIYFPITRKCHCYLFLFFPGGKYPSAFYYSSCDSKNVFRFLSIEVDDLL